MAAGDAQGPGHRGPHVRRVSSAAQRGQALSPGLQHGEPAVRGTGGRDLTRVVCGAGNGGTDPALGRRSVPGLLPHGQRRLHRGPARRLRRQQHAGAAPRARGVSLCLAAPRVDPRRAPRGSRRGLETGRRLRGQHRGLARRRAQRVAARLSHRRRRHARDGHPPRQRSPAPRRLRHAQEHAFRGLGGPGLCPVRGARLWSRRRPRSTAPGDHRAAGRAKSSAGC